MTVNKIIIYSDGAATMKKVDGDYIREAGGWAFVALTENEEIMFTNYGYVAQASNNAMELTAILKGLRWVFDECIEGTGIEIRSDSAYCVNIFTQWIESWKNNGWTRGKKHEQIENLEIIKSIYELIQKHKEAFNEVTFTKVKGHAGEKWNTLVDNLAVRGKMRDFDYSASCSIL